MGKFMNTESGSGILETHGKVIQWAATDTFAVWVPYGWLPIHFASNFDEPDSASLLWIFPIWSPKLIFISPGNWSSTIVLYAFLRLAIFIPPGDLPAESLGARRLAVKERIDSRKKTVYRGPWKGV